MKWTSPADIRAQVQKLWDRGRILASLAGGKPVFPGKMTLKRPSSKELADRFAEVRDWIAVLRDAAGPYRIVWRRVNHRILGTNDLPAEIWIDTLDDALALIGKRRAAAHFANLVETTGERLPEAVPWLAKRPLDALELAGEWPLLLDIAVWLREHPRPGIYLRRIDLPGVHTKLIEKRRKVLAELFDLVLPDSAIDHAYTGVGGFNRRYGFRDKPARIRFRLLDPEIRLLPTDSGRDITVTAAAFAGLDVPVSRVFITENEINFLAFPDVPEALVLFGAGYGFSHLASASWLQTKKIYYWGDIDTHGFAILNQLRKFFPHAVSFLMDQQTLLDHRQLWGREARPETASLTRLHDAERAVYDRLRQDHWGERVRLEQERIGYAALARALQRLV